MNKIARSAFLVLALTSPASAFQGATVDLYATWEHCVSTMASMGVNKASMPVESAVAMGFYACREIESTFKLAFPADVESVRRQIAGEVTGMISEDVGGL